MILFLVVVILFLVGEAAWSIWKTRRLLAGAETPNSAFRPAMSLEMYEAKVRLGSRELWADLFVENSRRSDRVSERVMKSRSLAELRALNAEGRHLSAQLKILLKYRPMARPSHRRG